VTGAREAERDAHSAEDERFMRTALALGRRNLGATWPNPSVGAVLVRHEAGGVRIVGEGVTQPGGRPHGEPVAIEQAGLLAVGGTLYVTLEPCSHRTIRGGMPCVEATIRAGVRRVVSAMDDPNPDIAGLGHALLRSLGVAVEVGLLGEEAARDQRGHILRVTQGRPAVTLKLARTADGYAGRREGPRLMITGEEVQARVHLMRAHADAILVGAGTVAADDPALTVRLPGLEHRSPVRVIVDSLLRTPRMAQLVATARERPTWIVAAEHAPIEPERELAACGVEVMRVEADAAGRVDLEAALRLLAARGVTRVFCEGGPGLADALAGAGLVDEVVLATAPERLSAPGVPAVGPRLDTSLRSAFRRLTQERAGADRIETYERI
jgi:diaminohydroxyphosphoribosylaminopyrimidine deaminase/5-amino-6-(5-phosphoribosylamino)uracil reductase